MNLKEQVCRDCRMQKNGNCHPQIRPINFEGGGLPEKPYYCGHDFCKDGPIIAAADFRQPTIQWVSQTVKEMDGQTRSVKIARVNAREKIGFFFVSEEGLIYTKQDNQFFATNIRMAE